jgi:hypothetical protein
MARVSKGVPLTLEAYARRVAEQGTAAEELHAYRAAHPDTAG